MIARLGRGAMQRVRKELTGAQGLWFDVTRNVQTSGYARLDTLTLQGEEKSGYDYLPTRPARARQVLRNLPVADYSEYDFVDLGSGKGRMLLIAAEFAFHGIEGVEFATELHAQALENIRRARRVRRRCDRIRSLNLDAIDYSFPLRNLVIYLFNPFGGEVLTKVLENLKATLEWQPRHAVVVLVQPDHASLFSRADWMESYLKTPAYDVYQTRRS